MSRMLAGSLIGLLYTGYWETEPKYTLYRHHNEFHVCEKETNSRKRIIAVFENETDAENFMELKRK